MRILLAIISGVLSCFFCMPASVMALDVQNHSHDPYLYMKVYGGTDFLYAEALHGGFFEYQGVYSVSHSEADKKSDTEPVTFLIDQVEASNFGSLLPEHFIISIPADSPPFDLWDWVFNNCSGQQGISYLVIRVTSPGDTITVGDNNGGYLVSTNADKTSITITSSEADSFLNPWNGSTYPPVLDLPELTFSDHDFSFVIEIGISSPSQDWMKQLYTEGITISKPLISPDIGIPDVFSIGITSVTIREGIILNVSSIALNTGQAYVTLPMFFSLSELKTAQVDLQSLRLYRYDESQGKWLLAGGDGKNNSTSGMFISGLPTDVPGDFGVHVDESQNLVLVWANIDKASQYSIGGKILSRNNTFPWNLFLPSIIKENRTDK